MEKNLRHNVHWYVGFGKSGKRAEDEGRHGKEAK